MRHILCKRISILKNFRLYGEEPYTVALLHGGPGAAGYMAPFAEELSKDFGVIEPLQTGLSVDEQIQELRTVLKAHGDLPLTLIGHSWGAWLGFIFSAKYSFFIKKLILISSGPFDVKYTNKLLETRLKRMSKQENQKIEDLLIELHNSDKKNEIFKQLGNLLTRIDSYDPVSVDQQVIECDYNIYQNVWSEASEMRKKGELLKYGQKIKCPVTAIHGDYDPHPAKGVEKPLRKVLNEFNFVLLKKCGHDPWNESYVKDQFYSLISKEIDE